MKTMLRGLLSTQDRQKLAPIFESLELSPDAIFVTDRHNAIVFWNEAARRVLGYHADDVIGRSCAELLKGCDNFGNRYCSENCPIKGIANRGDIIQHFDLKLVARDEHVVRAEIDVLQLRTTADEFLLLHMVRPHEAESRPAAVEGVPPQLHAVRESTDARVRKLTSRETEVLGMLAAGRSTPEIAERLHISVSTTRDHIQNILVKLELHSKAEAVAFAFQKNLI